MIHSTCGRAIFFKITGWAVHSIGNFTKCDSLLTMHRKKYQVARVRQEASKKETVTKSGVFYWKV